MQAQDEERRTQWTEWVTANAGANAARIPRAIEAAIAVRIAAGSPDAAAAAARESLVPAQDERKAEDQRTIAAPALKTDVEDEPVKEPEVYLKECASCGGQFPSFRAICSECEDIADVDGYRDGKKKAVASEGAAANS
jgi:hypothetical protein